MPTPDRWQHIESLYHAALERGRGALDHVDPELRREVESLLDAEPTAPGFLSQPLTHLFSEAGTMPFKPGVRLGPYQIEELIGEGGMGKVYRALDTRLGRRVAIKVSSARFSERFEREARSIAALNHPHICHLYDVGPDYLVMEYIEGAPLKGPIPINEALQYGEQIASALDAAHRKDIVHRDLKPANILLSDHGIKLLDFGVAQMKPGPDDPTSVTIAGAVVGTPSYMAPEQWQGQRADARSDIYSFGCVLYEILTGKRAGSPDAAVRVGVPGPPELERILAKCLEKDPALRYQHASDLRADLLRLKQEVETSAFAGEQQRAGVSRRWLKVLVAGLAIVALGIGSYVYLGRAPRAKVAAGLTDKDTILLADFSNQTGEADFDQTLRRGLAVALGQSPFITLVPDRRLQGTLAQMGRPANTLLTGEVAREVCERTFSAAVVEGSISKLGAQYVVGLKATTCSTGEVIDDEQVPVSGKENALSALNGLAIKFRGKAGESPETIRKHAAPLVEATTTSFEAWKLYSSAWNVGLAGNYTGAIPLLQRASQLDPQFAMAYALLGRLYADLAEPVLASDNLRKAYELREHATDPERLFIEMNYYLLVTGNLAEVERTGETWTQIYPRSTDALTLLSVAYQNLGKYEKSAERGRRATEINPEFPPGPVNLAWALLFLERYQNAEKVVQDALQRKLTVPDLFLLPYVIAFYKGDHAGMERAVTAAKDSDAIDWLTNTEGVVAAYNGHLLQARMLSRRAVELAQQAHQQDRAGVFEASAAVREALFADFREAQERAHAALGISRSRDVEYGAAFALAVSGDNATPEALMKDLAKRFPEDSCVRFTYIPVVHAVVDLNHGDTSSALEHLQTAAPYDLAIPCSWFGFYGNLYAPYMRGQAYLAARRFTEATTEFQKILDHPGIVFTDPVRAAVHLQIGRALASAGDRVRAKAAYHDFFTLWKGADPDIPLLKQARAEYPKL